MISSTQSSDPQARDDTNLVSYAPVEHLLENAGVFSVDVMINLATNGPHTFSHARPSLSLTCFTPILAIHPDPSCLLCQLKVCVLPPSSAQAAPFQMGTATVEMTPPVGYRMSGYFHERLSEGTKDPLLAKAIVFSRGGLTTALVCCDVIGIDPHVAHESRRLINEELGIPADNISVAATHSHTGPLYWGALRDQFHKAAVLRE